MKKTRLVQGLILSLSLLSTASSFADVKNDTASLAKGTVTLAQDSAITTYLYAKLAAEPKLSADNINITTNEGKVTLNGIVNNEDEAKILTKMAQSALGVKGVDSSKIIVAQNGNTLYSKTAAPVEPEINQAHHKIEVVPQKDIEEQAAADDQPLVTGETADKPEKLASNETYGQKPLKEQTLAFNDKTTAEPKAAVGSSKKAPHKASKKHHKKGKAKKHKGKKHAHKKKAQKKTTTSHHHKKESPVNPVKTAKAAKPVSPAEKPVAEHLVSV